MKERYEDVDHELREKLKARTINEKDLERHTLRHNKDDDLKKLRMSQEPY